MPNILFSCLIIFALGFTATSLVLSTLNILNSTEAFNNTFQGLSATNVTTALQDFVGCFPQSPLSEPQLSRTNFVDCFHAQEKMAALDPHIPLHFRRYTGSTFLLPNNFSYRTCLIFLDMVSADDEDFFYVSEITNVAIDTARKCTSVRKALGGVGMAGPKRLMEVYVTGRV